MLSLYNTIIPPTSLVNVLFYFLKICLGEKFSLYPSLVPMSVETHGGEDVAVWARGPWAHLFVGSFEQNVLPLIMSYASCIGPSNGKCSNR